MGSGQKLSPARWIAPLQQTGSLQVTCGAASGKLPPYSATQVFQRLREEAHTGGFSILKDYVRKVRPVRKPAFLTPSFEPGECARVTLDTNRYSVPSEYASTRLTLKAYPDHLVIYHQNKLIARHVRSYDRHQDFENPDHPRELLAQRRKAREQILLRRFLLWSPTAERYYQELQQRRLNPRHHIRKILVLSEIYGTENLSRAIEDAFT
ncbi:MAG: hypothetical protein L0Y38_06770, partial [Methylococcaceae bacterium]|nr:hypothetical protein [Methylococcaceae bacterium]